MRLTSAFLAPVLLAVGSIGSATAADLRPAYKAPVVAPAYSWTGFYLGAVAGYGFGETRAETEWVGYPSIHVNTRGWLAGGTIGYNYQRGNIVLGAEGELYASGIKGDTNIIANEVGAFSNKWTGTVAARLGAAFDRTLVYGKVGAAFARNDYEFSSPGVPSLGVTATETGWLVGAGVEWAFAGNWSAKFEAAYMDFGRTNHAISGGDKAISTDFESHVTSVKFGINYRFN